MKRKSPPTYQSHPFPAVNKANKRILYYKLTLKIHLSEK